MEKSYILEKLCIHDSRNPYFDKEYSEGSRPDDCYCDNCFYGRSVLAEELLKYFAEKEN